MAKRNLKGCMTCRNTGWVTVLHRKGEYCNDCPRGSALYWRHRLHMTAWVLGAIAAAWALKALGVL